MQVSNKLMFAALLLSSFSLFAQDAAPANDPLQAAPVTETATEEEEDDDAFSLTGYVDAYYQGNLSSVDGEGDNKTFIPFGSSFTGATNTFGIGNVNLLAEKSVGKVSFVGQIGFGPRAVEGNSDSNLGGLLTGNFASTIQQLFVSYSPSESVTFTLGNFGTFVGYEVIDAPANMNYSMSHLFSNGPFYHTGAKVDFSFGEGFGAMVGIFNDTDAKVDQIEGKHIGGQLSYSNDAVGIYLNAITGKEAEDVSGEEDLTEFQIDLTATFQASESIMIGLNASQYSTSLDGDNMGGFFGTALYLTAALSETADLSLRGEYFTNTAADDDDTDQANVLGLTASGNFKVGDLRIIPEIRIDSGSNDFHGFGEDDDSAIAFILAGVYSF